MQCARVCGKLLSGAIKVNSEGSDCQVKEKKERKKERKKNEAKRNEKIRRGGILFVF